MATNPQAPGSPLEPMAELDLRDYVRILSRRKRVVVLAFVVVLGSAMVATFLRTPVYEAKADLLFQARVSEVIFDANRVEQRDAATDNAVLLHLLDAPPARRRRQADLLGKIGDGQRRVFLKDAKNFSVESVHAKAFRIIFSI